MRFSGGLSSAQAYAARDNGGRRKIDPWFSTTKSGSVGELPEATNASLCEDINPPDKRRCLRKFGRGLRWFLPLQAVSLHSKVSTVAFSLARLPGRQRNARS